MEYKICSFTAPGYRLQLIVKNDTYLLLLNRKRISIIQPHPVIKQPLLDCAVILFNRYVSNYTYLYSRKNKCQN